MTVTPKKRLLDVEEYQRMFEVGILTERDRVELINGEIIEMSPIGNKHAALVDRLSNYLAYHLFGKAIIRVQSPIILNDQSEPEPDISVLHWKNSHYEERHPGPTDVLFLIEVADSSIEYDREIKLPLYAAAGIAVCWIVDITKKCIEVYKNPSAGRFELYEVLTAQDSLSIPGFELELAVGELFK